MLVVGSEQRSLGLKEWTVNTHGAYDGHVELSSGSWETADWDLRGCWPGPFLALGDLI